MIRFDYLMDDWIVCQSYVHCSNTRLLWVTLKESRKLTHPIIWQLYVRGRKVKKHWPLFPTVVPPDGIAPQYRRLPDALCPLNFRNWDDRQTFHTWRSGTSLAPITTLGLVLNCMFSFELGGNWKYSLMDQLPVLVAPFYLFTKYFTFLPFPLLLILIPSLLLNHHSPSCPHFWPSNTMHISHPPIKAGKISLRYCQFILHFIFLLMINFLGSSDPLNNAYSTSDFQTWRTVQRPYIALMIVIALLARAFLFWSERPLIGLARRIKKWPKPECQ